MFSGPGTIGLPRNDRPRGNLLPEHRARVPGDPIITLDGVQKRYGTVEALASVSFGLHRNEAVGYLGPNGAGKTTTLRIISGLAHPDAGTVSVGGVDPAHDRRRALAHLGLLIETPGVLPYLTGEDMLGYMAEIKGVSRLDRGRAVERVARALGVAEDLTHPLGSLSTGRLRRLQVAGALIGDPEVLLLDEPTLGLDPVARRDLRLLLRDLHRNGVSLFFSTHLLEDVEAVCDRVLFLRNGRVVGDEPVDGRVGGEVGGRTIVLHVRTLSPVTLESVGTILGPDVAVEQREAREVTLRFTGDEAAQSALIQRLVTGGIPIVSAESARNRLEERYLERVGREES